MRLVFDIEANGFLKEASQVHCMAVYDLDNPELGVMKYRPSEVVQGLSHLASAEQIIGHNVIQYDLPVLQKVFPWFHYDEAKVQDTLVLSRLLWLNLSDLDNSRRIKPEGKLIGSHSLKAWGQRLQFDKLDYQGGFEDFNEEMLEYNGVDVEVTARLWEAIQKKPVDPRAVLLEHQVAFICARQERQGFCFDEQKARQLAAKLQSKRLTLEQELQDTFKPFYMSAGVKTPTRTTNGKKQAGTWAGAPYEKIKLTQFNPGSRHHITHRLKALYGWVPSAEEITPSGQPKIDETVLGKLEYPEAKLLSEYFLVQKRLGMLVDGDNAWLKLVYQGKIHGEVLTNGAVTGRATHRNPNVAQVPSVDAPYGPDCRELFGPESGLVEVGIDVSGLELRMLAHFLAKWDGGAYGEVVCNGDIHSANQAAAGLATRSQAKTFIYAFLYGAGDWKIGHIVEPLSTDSRKKKLGKELKSRFIKKVPGLAQLITGVKAAAQRGYLVGLDGRHLHIRSDHAALNTLLQSAGALICKQWMVEVDTNLRNILMLTGEPMAQQLAWIHDELQFQCRPNKAEEFGEMAVNCIPIAGAYFNVRVPLTGEYKIGKNWKECH